MAELHHYTREQVEEILDHTLEILAARELPPELREAAFGKVFERLSEKSIIGYQQAGLALPGPIQ